MMTVNHSSASSSLFLIALFIICTTSLQGQNQPTTSAPVKKFDFTANMESAAQDFQVSNIYHASFRKTQETNYLVLASDFCLKAITTLNDTQKQLSRTNRFHFQAKAKKRQACEFYQVLLDYSSKLPIEKQLKPIRDDRCEY